MFFWQILIFKYSFFHNYWFDGFHQGINSKHIMSKKAFDLKLIAFCTINKIFLTDRTFRKVQLILLFCRCSNSYLTKALLWYYTVFASVIKFCHKLFVQANYKMKNQTRKQKLDFFRQCLNRKPLFYVRSTISTSLWWSLSQCDCASCFAFLRTFVHFFPKCFLF